MGRTGPGSILLMCALLAACSTNPATPIGSPGSEQAAPESAPPGGWCTDVGIESRVAATFAALNSGDATALSQAFEMEGEGFELTATITDAMARGVRYQPSSLVARDSNSFKMMAAQFHGLTVRLTTRVIGGASGFGPVSWDAGGQAAGRRVLIRGGGKGRLNCATGRLQKLLLSPLSIS